MKPAFDDFSLPPEKEALLQRARRLEWISIAFLLSIIAAVGLAAGGSQTMKAMWVEDTVSLIPSTAFLLGAHYRKKKPNDRFRYGYRRAVLVGYLAGSVALFGFGVWILGDSVSKLVTAEHPSIPTVGLFGDRVWLGWFMIAALVYSCVPPFILGRMKIKLARELHDNTLYTSARIDKGDWLAGLAGVAGILGIAFGYWWADGAAAGLISFEIVKDGYGSLRDSVVLLMNHRPTDMEGKEDPVDDQVQEAVSKLEWVADARVRLRVDGDTLAGEVFVVPRDEANLLGRLEHATDLVRSVDWRLHDVHVVPVTALA